MSKRPRGERPAGRGDRQSPTHYSNTMLIGVSLLLATFIWVVAKQGEVDTDSLRVEVNITGVPAHISVEVEPSHIESSLRFPRSLRGEMLASNFGIFIDAAAINIEQIARMPTQARQFVSYPLKQSNFRPRQGLQFAEEAIVPLRFVPETIQVSASFIGEMADIRPITTGDLLPGHRLNQDRMRVRPREVFIAGAPERLESLRDPATQRLVVPTRAMRLDALRATTVMQPELDLPPGLRVVDAEQRMVEVTVVIEEERVTRTITGLPIRIPHVSKDPPVVEPAEATVVLDGPRSLVAGIQPEHLRFLLMRSVEELPGTSASGIPIEVRVTARPGEPLHGREIEITVISVQPSTIRIGWPAPVAP